MRVLACSGHLAGELLRSQRVLLPVIGFAVVLGVLYGGDPGPLPGPWAASVLALDPVAAWIGLAVAHAEEPPARLVTMTAAGGPVRVVAATLALALLADVALAVVATGLPWAITRHPVPPGAVPLGLCAHLAAAATGTAVGLLAARPLITRIGWSFVLAAVVITVTAVQPWLPPVGTAVAAITAGRPMPWVAGLLGLALAGGAAVLVGVVESRR